MNPSTSRTRQILLLIIVITVLIGVGIWLLVPHHSSPSSQNHQLATTAYQGTDALLTVGATSDVIKDFKFAMHQFLLQHPPVAQTVIIRDVEHHHIPGTLSDAYSFSVRLRDGTYEAELDSADLSSASLTLKQNSTTVFTSPSINVGLQP